MLPMGIILKWGTYTITGGNFSQTITFSNAFPNALFGVELTCSQSAANGDLSISYSSPSVTGFTGMRLGSPGTSANYFFIAIGN